MIIIKIEREGEDSLPDFSAGINLEEFRRGITQRDLLLPILSTLQ